MDNKIIPVLYTGYLIKRATIIRGKRLFTFLLFDHGEAYLREALTRRRTRYPVFNDQDRFKSVLFLYKEYNNICGNIF